MIHSNTTQSAINTGLSKCVLPHREASGGRYSRHHSPLCVFGEGRGKVGVGGFGLREE